MSTKLFFDARNIRTDFHDGLSRYATELGNAVASLSDVTFIICDKRQLKHLPSDCKHVIIHPPTSILEPFTSIILNKFKPDVVFTPLQTMGSLGRKFKLVLNQQDIIYYRYKKPPTWLSPALRLGWFLYHLTYIPGRFVLNRADLIATVSETSKKEIIEHRLTRKTIIVVPNAPNDLHKYLSKKLNISKPPKNLVYMGAFMPYKNVEVMVKAMDQLPDYKLHLLSRITEQRKNYYLSLIKNKSSIVFHNGVTDEEYAKVLADRALLVSGSKAEGFGIPIAEAMTLGVPAVVHDMPIHHEVGGNGALYFDGDNPNDFVNKVKEASEIKKYQELSRNASKINQRFSWTKSAQNLLDAIEKIL